MDLDLNNDEFQTALSFIQETNQTFFLTGKAGTGKSTFLKYIVDTISKNFVVIAPTGIAAVNVSGVTVHSFFQFPLRPLLPQDEDIKVFWRNSEKRKIISEMDTLIIDEISMVRADLIDGIDYSLRRNGGNPNLPFGGKQVVFVGDIFQLEPVTITSSGEKNIISELYGSVYFYNAKVFENLKLFTIELQKVYRQVDPDFISLLDKVRVKEVSQKDIEKINSRVFSENQLAKKVFAITLTTKNSIADSVNSIKLNELKTTSFVYPAEVTGIFENSKYPTEPELILKKGSQVIFIKNDMNKRWVNGTIGQVCELTENVIKVRLKDGEIHSVEKRVWENIKYQYNKEKKKIDQDIIGTFEQYPLKLAWAITIHKSQGLTFDRVVIDFGSGTFASGQAYVALSRATTFEGLFLKQKIRSTDIYIDNEIKDFAESFNDDVIINEKLSFGKKIHRYQKTNNLESLGEFFFDYAIFHLLNGDFKLAFDHLVTGYEFVSCDCNLSRLIKRKQEKILLSLNNNNVSCTFSELNFINAILYLFFRNENDDQNTNYTKALHYITSFLENNPNSEIGHYLKGRIFSELDKLDEALSELYISLSIKNTPRVLYRIGRIKEEKMNKIGIGDIFESVILNPSSICSNRYFRQFSDKRKIKLFPEDKLLANKFNNSRYDDYLSTISKLLNLGEVKLTNGTTLLARTAFSDFINVLKANELKFGIQTTSFLKNPFDSDDYHDYDRDTFDAMTDGQLGDWDDFDGDIDDVSTWSGR